MKFSIITVCHNEEARIENTLKSIYSQSFHDFEHIIQDGGSTDNTLELIRRCEKNYSKDVLRIFSEKDNGLYDAMNRALTHVKGDYVCFINSGDLLFDEDTLERVSREMEKNPGMDWYYGTAVYVFPNQDEFIQIPCTLENREGNDITELLKKEQLRLNHQSIFASRRCFENNRFDTKYKLRAEVKWYYKCLLGQKKIKTMKFPVCRYALGGCSERVASVSIHAKEMRNIFEELGLLRDDNRNFVTNANSTAAKNIYNNWLALRQAGKTVSDYLLNQKICRIAIYGYSEFGTHLINELKGSPVEIVCMIDRQDKYPFSKIPVISPNDKMEEVDAIIVTALMQFKEIKQDLETKTNCQIISLEDILEDMWL